MIPTWRPDPSRLREALESVLAQTRTGGRFQVTVVEDASPAWVGRPRIDPGLRPVKQGQIDERAPMFFRITPS